MQSLPAGVGQEGIAQREHTCPRTPRALHPHFEAPRSPLDATAAHPAQAETSERTQTARRGDKPTNHQTTALISMRHLRHSPPVQRQASRPALLLTAPPAPKQWWNSRPPVQSVVEPLHPTPIRRTRDYSSGAVAEQTWIAKIRHPRKIPPFQHHDDPGCCPCAEGAAGALQKNAPSPHLMPLGMAPCSFAQYDLAGHNDSTPTSPRNLPISSHAGAPGAAADGTAGAATGAEAVVELAPRPRTLQITPPLCPHHAQHGSQPQLQAASE